MARSVHSPSDLERFKAEGYLVIDEALALEQVTALRESYLKDLRQKVARFALEPAAAAPVQTSPHQKVLNAFKPVGGNHDFNRWNMHLPSMPTYLSPALLANPRVLEVARTLIGGDFVAYLIASDTPFPGSTFQNIHQDFSRFSLALNIPLVDVTEANGPLELWPGTHCRAPADFSTDPLPLSPEQLAHRAQQVQPRRMVMPAGSMLLRDHRLMHRGTANVSTEPRPMLSIYYAAPHPVPPRWMADLGVRASKLLRTVGRGRGEQVQREALFSLGNVLGRVVEECSLSDRDHRRPIPSSLWASLPDEVRGMMRFSRVQGGHPAAEGGRSSMTGAVHLLEELVANSRESLASSWRGTPRRPDRQADLEPVR